MRASLAATVLLAAILSGCASIPPAPDSPTTSSAPHPTTQPPTTTAVACHYGATAVWREPGLFARAQNASFAPAPPRPGLRVTEPKIVADYGTFNLTRVFRQGPGETGTLRALSFITTPEAIILGDFVAGNTTEQRRLEFLAFARPLLASDDATLQSWADQFAASSPKEPGSVGHWVKVTGPFKTDSFVAHVRAIGTDTLSEAARVVWKDGAWSVEAFVTVLHRPPTQAFQTEVKVNQFDVVELFAPGMKERAGAWTSANQTFAAYGWPHPDLTDANVRCS